MPDLEPEEFPHRYMDAPSLGGLLNLPVSSTSHLILAGHFTGFEGEASTNFKIAVQLGAILAVIVAYPQRLAGGASV